jgi:hypothetical protein
MREGIHTTGKMPGRNFPPVTAVSRYDTIAQLMHYDHSEHMTEGVQPVLLSSQKKSFAL